MANPPPKVYQCINMAVETPVGIFEVVDYFSDLRILITGRSGTSKSVVVNGLLGKQVVEERHGVVTETREGCLQEYSESINDTKVTVWISSSFQDGCDNEEEILKKLKEKCSNLDLIIYCIKMTETRFTSENPDAVAISKITRALGSDCWQKAVFVLTYANVAVSIQGVSRNSNYSAEEIATFQRTIQQWESVLQNTLVQQAQVPHDKSDVKVVPAGHHAHPHLPGHKFWMSNIWSTCVEKIPSELAKQAIIKMNKNRLTRSSNTVAQDFEKNIHEQPIIVEESRFTAIMWSLIVRIITSLYDYGMSFFDTAPR